MSVLWISFRELLLSTFSICIPPEVLCTVIVIGFYGKENGPKDTFMEKYPWDKPQNAQTVKPLSVHFAIFYEFVPEF